MFGNQKCVWYLLVGLVCVGTTFSWPHNEESAWYLDDETPMSSSSTVPLSCGGSPICSGQGFCVRGQCECSGNWTGPICNFENTPANVTMSPDAPSVILSAISSFSVTVKTIHEVDQHSNTLETIELASSPFTLREAKEAEDNSTRVWNYETILSNNATLVVTFIHFLTNALYTFANTTSTYLPGTVKMNLNITAWPFLSEKNSLLMSFLCVALPDQSSSDGGCTNFESLSDQDNSLKYFLLTEDGTTMYGKFQDAAIVDGQNRDISFSLYSQSIVQAKIPYFSTFAAIDPTYIVFLDKNFAGCGNQNDLVPMLKIVAPTAVGLIVVGMLLLLVLKPRLRAWQHLRRAVKQGMDSVGSGTELSPSSSTTPDVLMSSLSSPAISDASAVLAIPSSPATALSAALAAPLPTPPFSPRLADRKAKRGTWDLE